MALAQTGQHREPIHAGQQDVHEHHIERLAAGQFQPFLAVLAPGHVEPAAAQLLVDIGAQHEIVFNGKNAGMTNGSGIHDYLQIILSCRIIQDRLSGGNRRASLHRCNGRHGCTAT